MALPSSAVGWSAVYDCGISWSYSLIFSQSIHSMTLSLASQYFFYFCKGDIDTEDLGSFQYLQSKSSQSGPF